MAMPAMPKLGIGPQPKPKTPLKVTCATQAINNTKEGVFMLPEPRMTEAKPLVSQTLAAPQNATFA